MSPHEQVSVVRDLAGNLPIIYFDKEKMRRVVINLVENSVQAVLARRIVEEGDSYRPWVCVRTSLTDTGLRIDVEDNGIGMNDDTAGHAFEPLFTTRARGTGLGLAIVRKIIQEHGGSVSLTTAPNRGTTVTLVLPSEPLVSVEAVGHALVP
jgi:signal transduction histidine kinase